MPLSMASEGTKVKIKRMYGGHGLLRRLHELGLVENGVVEIITNHFHGPMILKVFDSRVVIGRGQTHKIFVENVFIER
ncbi:MAG: ferrous iron transport protein A [Candidatus Altiarchaeum hamiconexum]|uniref:Ferrous iron transport protein A n=1 Tax=Candidatus Altarchaeum hamiconexum TaxID=1803513 RepID=A0A8J7Z1H7_9ARCH|nr:ferrous iron transport protein A [Candidatus Altarchaeum hamiconexum]OIQ04839.1 MAG: hypothetical protein AUK59_06180 [Candidatus Altarchaeum sp. CG2_30_32_3053]PIN67499.1 MAG: hypothetical protein COV98_02620 [Candidatus Altarchaeum sp. CG12_big_fil_rev_8_21_14_0_65_33_22]PIV27884.1 MAG: hypothetical protein COS36_04200 [Candidatus Altarchaeum sp. CG03_land_8_20_14_0_80_32_618]PIX48987.1 MAG: hypothetical protein COZ53_02155 [Candidatus Altarchaeum sp. CG_4_8_14_3_um_filter_33_2054]PIZ3274